jgi:uncharacterized protein (UPF0332 family)
MTIKDSERKAIIKIKIEKSEKCIDDVAFLIENDKLVLAVNRIYYGIFYAISALALRNSFLTNKHQQLIGWFNSAGLIRNMSNQEKLIVNTAGYFIKLLINVQKAITMILWSLKRKRSKKCFPT